MRTTLYRCAALLFVVLAGCANPFMIKSDYTFAEHPGEGVIVFSTRWAYECPNVLLMPPPVSQTLFYTGNDSRFGVYLYHSGIKRDFENPPGYIFALPHKAGAYRFNGISFSRGGKLFKSPTPTFAFQVREGKITYLGEITIRVSECHYKPSWGEARFDIAVSNQWGRDRQLLTQRMIKENTNAAIIEILRP